MATADPVVLDRLHKASARLMMAVSNLLRLTEAFDELNSPGDRRKTLARSPAAAAIFLYENAILREQIITITRIFDPPRKDRLSFPVVLELINKPGVIEHFIADARDWPGQDPDTSEATVRRSVSDLAERVERLRSEDPNRLKLLKDFRDENIAHELWFETPRERPVFSQVWSLVPEAKACAEEVQLVVDGASIGWAEGMVKKSTKWLWDSVAAVAAVSS